MGTEKLGTHAYPTVEVQRWSQKGASVMLLPSSPAPSFRLSPTVLQLQLPLPMGAGLYDGFFFLLLKLLEQVPV